MDRIVMDQSLPIGVTPLGQAGFRFVVGETVLYVDPYLSDSVAEVEGEVFRRLTPSPLRPDEISNADYVLISHLHLDHCDPATLVPIYHNAKMAKFICPAVVADHLVGLGFQHIRIVVADESWITINRELSILPIAAAHPTIQRDSANRPRCVGYVIKYRGKRIYHGGDTSPAEPLIETLKRLRPIDTAFLPVNERNYYREKRRIIGNMSVREAFAMAEEIGVRKLVPTHWDLFKLNAVYRDEIELLYMHIRPAFELCFNPVTI